MGNLINHYREILRQIMERLPACEIHVMAYYPIANMELPPMPGGRKPRTLEAVQEANRRVRAMAKEDNFIP